MNVLVTGGTGFVGQEILRRLRVSGHRSHVLVRDPEAPSAKDALQCGAHLRTGNILDRPSLVKACSGMDAVIHLVGIISEIGLQTFENVHVRGTHNILFAARGAGVKRFVHMSALGARADARSRYHSSKWAAEDQVRRSDIPWTIFRPSIIYGPGDGFVNLFASMIRRSPIVPVIGSPRSRFQPISVQSVAIAFVKSLTEAAAVGQTIDLCGSETLTLNRIIDETIAALDKHRLKIRIPNWVVRMQASLMERIYPRFFGKASPLNRDQLIMLQEDNVGDGTRACELFGLRREIFAQGISYVARNA